MASEHPVGSDGLGLVARWASAVDGSGRWFAVPGEAGARVFRKGGWVGFREACGAWAVPLQLDPSQLAVVDELPANGLLPGGVSVLPLVEAVELVGNGALQLSLRIPFGLSIFAGHFPTVPIVPGAMLVGWTGALAEKHLGWKMAGMAIPAVKFRRIVQPGLRLVLKLQLDTASRRLDFRYSGAGGLHAVGALQVAE